VCRRFADGVAARIYVFFVEKKKWAREKKKKKQWFRNSPFQLQIYLKTDNSIARVRGLWSHLEPANSKRKSKSPVLLNPLLKSLKTAQRGFFNNNNNKKSPKRLKMPQRWKENASKMRDAPPKHALWPVEVRLRHMSPGLIVLVVSQRTQALDNIKCAQIVLGQPVAIGFQKLAEGGKGLAEPAQWMGHENKIKLHYNTKKIKKVDEITKNDGNWLEMT
jgi:hypothetical protein